ncbi:FG-GAP-like repeat-containing protein [bacterium]|nr:FG-GAP-like repeat-containing protein [bacterium]
MLAAIGIFCALACHPAFAVDTHANFVFGAPQKIATSTGYNSIAVGDLDGDGSMDLVASNPLRGFVAGFINNGDMTFSGNTIDRDSGGTANVKTADLDQDGDMDVLTANPGLQTIVWYENLGTKPPTFAKHVISAVERETRDVAVADLDGDGDMDIAEVKYDGDNVVWFKNEGTTFTRHVIDRELDESVSVSTADINGDGANDIIACAGMKNKLVLYLNNGAHHPTFTPILVSESLTWTMKAGAADFDADGHLDIFGYGQYSDDTAWFQNNGGQVPGFTKYGIHISNNQIGAAAVAADVDLDGRPDIVTGNLWFRNKGGATPTFQAYYLNCNINKAASNAVARLDADAYPDYAWVDNYVYVARSRYRRTEDLKPINRTPLTGQVVSVRPRLGIDDPDYMSVNTHTATQWQIAPNSEFTTPTLVYDSGYSTNLQQIVIGQSLQPNTTYWFRARRHFTDGDTPWSKPTSFRTVERLITVSGSPDGFGTIQAALDAAPAGSTIVVPRALYTENIKFKGRNVTLRSEDVLDTHTVAATIIDGNWAGSTVSFSGTETTSCVLAGFTIRNGWSGYGGGVYGKGCTATVEHNIITMNTASNGGGISHCQGIIQFNQIVQNKLAHSNNGAGVYYCNGEIRNNVIARNGAEGASSTSGGGLSDCKGSIHNNEIAENKAYYGAGLFNCNHVRANVIRGNKSGNTGGGLSGCIYVDDNLIVSNMAAYSGALYQCAQIRNNTIVKNTATNYAVAAACATKLINCIVRDNTAIYQHETVNADYSCIDIASSGNANISADPQFVNAAAGDYRLKATSPCIDAGMNSGTGFDINGAPHGVLVVGGRGDGSNYDMGAYEYIPNDILVNAPQGDFLTGTQIRVTGWFYTPTVGNTVRIELWRGGQKVVVLGEVFSSSGSFDQVFTLPVLASGSYEIRAISLVNPALSSTGATPVAIIYKNAVRSGNWPAYQ